MNARSWFSPHGLAAALFFVVACNSAPSASRGSGPGRDRELRYPVEVVPVQTQQVDYVVRAVGSVEAFERVQIAARVAGAVERVRFAVGDTVKEGQVLAQIDAERYEIAVRAARAALARAEAANAEAQAGLKRREGILAERPDLITREELETWRTRAQTTSAQVAEAKAALDQAELNRRGAYPWAPAAGVIETRSVETGQYVQPGALLATLVRREPLLLKFQVPERDARALARDMVASFRTSEGGEPIAARITHVGQSAEAGSRLVQVTAEIDDPRKDALRAGSFAEVSIVVDRRAAAPIIPQIAVRPSERGFLVFVVEGDVARERTVELGMRTPDGHLEVRSGLVPGERLVVRGAEALTEGAKVTVNEVAAPAPPQDTAASTSFGPGGGGGGADREAAK